ncbi:hypothetical protein JCM11251_003434 [Rhodosporidiobolus azoricus]
MFAVSVKDKVDVLRPLLLPVVRQSTSPPPHTGAGEAPSEDEEGGAAMNEGIQVSQLILCTTSPSPGDASASTTPRGGDASMTHLPHTDHRPGPTTTAPPRLAQTAARQPQEGEGSEAEGEDESLRVGEEHAGEAARGQDIQPARRTDLAGSPRSHLSPLNAEAPPFTPAPPPLPWPRLEEDKVRSAIFAARPFAAAGPYNLPNVVLQHCWPALRLRLVPLYAAVLHTGFIPKAWQDASAVVLTKPKKEDYSNPKAYRLIAFERCIAKGVELIIANRLAYPSEEFQLLPPEYAGGRRGRSAQDVVACIVDAIKCQWRAGNFVVGLALDVAKAFPSVRVEKLVEDLQAMGLPAQVCCLVRSFMEERFCRLHFEGTVSDLLAWESGLPQGSPLSPILFLLYNSALINLAHTPSSRAFGWIDNVNVIAWGPSVAEAVAAAQSLVPEMEDWSRTHHSAFEPAKTTATVFRPPQRALPTLLPPIILGGESIAFSPSLTLLGTELDETLSFRGHQAQCAAKAATAVTGVALLSRAKGGLRPILVRSLVKAVVEPRLTWMGEIWGETGISKASAAVWKDAARLVCGGYRSSAAAALKVEANLPPLDLVLRSLRFRLALRALAAPPQHLLHLPCQLARLSRPRRHASPIHTALHAFPSIFPPTIHVETLLPWPIPPWDSTPSPTTLIAPSKETGLPLVDEHLAALPPFSLVAYSDGSMLDGAVGAASVIEVVGMAGSLQKVQVLGGQQTVWAGEGDGAHLSLLSALDLLCSHPHSPALSLLIDNQGLVSSPFSPLPSPGQSIRLRLCTLVTRLTSSHPQVRMSLVWCPGHHGVDGNEAVDALAKDAAEEGGRREREREAVTGGRCRGRGAGRGRGRRTRAEGRAAVLFRASQVSVSSLSSEGSEWDEGDDEVSWTWAVQEELRRSRQRSAQHRAGLLANEVEGGMGLPKSLSALKQEQREEMMATWARRWLVEEEIVPHPSSPTSGALPALSNASTTTSDHYNPGLPPSHPSSAESLPLSPSTFSLSLPTPASPSESTSSSAPSLPFTAPSLPFTLSTAPCPLHPCPPPTAAAIAARPKPLTGKGLRAVDRRPPGPAFVRHIHTLPRRSATLLSRLCLDFCDLGGTKRMLAENDPLCFCECGGGVETCAHYLLECRRYEEQRRTLAVAVRKAGGGSLSLSTIFSPRFTPFLLRFLHLSQRFPSSLNN